MYLHMKSPWILLLLIINFNSFAQDPFTKYLSLPRKQMLDSIETHSFLAKSRLDTTRYFAGVKSLSFFAKKNNDAFLMQYADFLEAVFYLSGKQKFNVENKLVKIKNALLLLESGDEKDMLMANIEHYRGLNIVIQNMMSAKALKHFLSADLIYRKLGYQNVTFAGYKLNNIGQYYQLVAQDYKNALKYYLEAEKYIEKDPIDLNRIFFYRSMAKTLVYHGEYDEAIKYNKLGIAQVRLRKDSLRIGSLLGNIGEIILNHKPNPSSAERYFLEELKYRNKYNPKGFDDIAKVYANLCQIAALKKQKSLSDSLFLLSVKTLAAETDSMKVKMAQRAIYKNKIIADTLLKNFESAYRHQQLLQNVQDEIFKQELKEATTKATVLYDTEKFRMEAELANQQSKNARFWFAIVSLLLIITIVGAYVIYIFWKMRGERLSQTLDFERKEAERLAEIDNIKNRFFTNISHELRTPLTLLLAPISDLEAKFGTNSILTLMKSNLGRLNNLINQILDLSKLEAGKMKVNAQNDDLVFFVRNILASFESLANSKNIKLNLVINASKLIFGFDKDKLEKILNNLISNAIKYTPENGNVNVTVRENFGEVIFKIEDTGIGIEQSQIPKIFDRYYQIENNNNQLIAGTGVGLALVKELVAVMNGKIEVESLENAGTTFRVILPNIDSEKETVSKYPNFVPESEVSGIDAKGLLLVVEDNDDLRKYIQSLFFQNFRVLEAKDGKSGLEIAINEIPDLIITDLMMPNINGLGLCKLIKADRRVCHIPIIMLTAKADLDSRIEGFETGADEYLAKPFSPNELKVRVSNLLKNRNLFFEKYGLENPRTTSSKDLNQIFIKNIIDLIDIRLSDSSLNIEDLAENLNLSSIQLRRKLKAITGSNPTEYVRNYRLQKAEIMLKAKTSSVSEIAYKVGFESLSYFSKVFQEKYGKLPSEW